MDELGNFGHVSVPIMEGPGQCLWLKIGAIFMHRDWCTDQLYDVMFFTNFYFFGMPNIALLLGVSIGFWFEIKNFFVLRVTYLLLGFTGG
jgi:hypothetical protein